MAKYDVVFSCGHEGVVSLTGRTDDRERRLNWYHAHGLCKECYAAEQREREIAIGLTASIRLQALSTMMMENPYPTICIVFDGDTRPHKEELKRMGATWTRIYPEQRAFADLLGINPPPFKWVMRVTSDQIEQAVADLNELNCTITDVPSDLDFKIFMAAFEQAKRNQEEKTNIEKEATS